MSGTNRNRPWHKRDSSPAQIGTRPWDKPAFVCLIPQQNCQGRILAVWIFAAKLPNSDLHFAVDFLVDFFLLFFPRKKARKKSTKKSPAKFTRDFVRRNSPRISAEAFSRKIAILSHFVPGTGGVRPWNDCPTSAVREMFMCFLFAGFFSPPIKGCFIWRVPDKVFCVRVLGVIPLEFCNLKGTYLRTQSFRFPCKLLSSPFSVSRARRNVPGNTRYIPPRIPFSKPLFRKQLVGV